MSNKADVDTQMAGLLKMRNRPFQRLRGGVWGLGDFWGEDMANLTEQQVSSGGAHRPTTTLDFQYDRVIDSLESVKTLQLKLR